MATFVTVDSSLGSNSKRNEGGIQQPEPTTLQKHVMYFDINKDGIIYPWETYQGLRALGAGILFAAVVAIFIHLVTSRKTRPGKGFNIYFPIVVANIKYGKHGSDSGVYDTEGRFVPRKFEEIFQHAHKNPNYLTFGELNEMIKANRQPGDYYGWFRDFTQWMLLYILFRDKQGNLQKETVRTMFDGSLFEQTAKEKKASK